MYLVKITSTKMLIEKNSMYQNVFSRTNIHQNIVSENNINHKAVSKNNTNNNAISSQKFPFQNIREIFKENIRSFFRMVFFILTAPKIPS